MRPTQYEVSARALVGVLRLRRRMTLDDALVAATALVHNLTLVTRNTKDFAWISKLQLLNPFEQ